MNKNICQAADGHSCFCIIDYVEQNHISMHGLFISAFIQSLRIMDPWINPAANSKIGALVYSVMGCAPIYNH